MKLLVLCGGQGTRLRSVVNDVPKPLAPINGVPFLEILINKYMSIGFEDIVISAGYKSDLIEDFVRSRYQNSSISIISESDPLGTGGAVRLVCEQNPNDQKYLVVNGDTYISNLPEMKTFDMYAASNKFAIFGKTGANDSEARYSSFNINRSLRLVTNQKLANKFISYGMYLIENKTYCEYAAINKKVSIDKIFRSMINDGLPVSGKELDSTFIDIGIPADYNKFQEMNEKLILG